MSSPSETEIDGVLCFWVDTGRPLTSARLVFRSGESDEPLHESGWLHLIEHLALHERNSSTLRVDGSVSSLLTSFELQSTTEEAMVEALLKLTGWLANPDFHYLIRERFVLRGRAEVRDDPLRRSLSWRYGATGPGVASFDEAGAVRATPDALIERAQRVFNGSNAILVLNAPPPADLKLRLPYGEYHAPSVAAPIPRAVPTAYADERGLVLSGVVDRTLEGELLAELLERAVHDELRSRTGGAYGPWSAIEPVDTRHAVVAGGSGLVPEMLPTIAEIGLDLARHLAEISISRGHLQEAVHNRVLKLTAPTAPFRVAMAAAEAVLADQVPKSQEELVAELQTLDLRRIETAAAKFDASLLVGLPEAAKLPADLEWITFPESEPTNQGRRHRHVDWPADATTFAADATSIETVNTDGVARTMPVADVVGLLAWRDGTRKAVSRNGAVLEMEAGQWRHSAELTQAIDAAVAPHLHMEMPDRAITFTPMSPGDRALTASLRWADTTQGLLVLSGVFIALTMLWVMGGQLVPAVVFLVVAASLGGRVWLRERAHPELEEEPA
jgi:hypothetical protein